VDAVSAAVREVRKMRARIPARAIMQREVSIEETFRGHDPAAVVMGSELMSGTVLQITASGASVILGIGCEVVPSGTRQERPQAGRSRPRVDATMI
jgi:hypothetical protein